MAVFRLLIFHQLLLCLRLALNLRQRLQVNLKAQTVALVCCTNRANCSRPLLLQLLSTLCVGRIPARIGTRRRRRTTVVIVVGRSLAKLLYTRRVISELLLAFKTEA